ncbi:TetR/AcrR family transcriptional regulator [Microbacterium sp. STN6]|uniref:TetR/AcrR family transcriptional regulator n=1 Tax=Microbacterium sp. STN6 TaxID=2995588 RepID=UPI002260BABA|nr:TetR/AcrR family transcriptional regulator [Microbacterium sp. STN6]MCX7522701.1 TetR/AcrR family transcriptional regulator [Microbacterium sp. STN6]
MSTIGRTRGSYAKTAARRREILDAALEVFSSSGFRSGSIRDIADRVGMSQAGVLHHFRSKNELLAQVLQARDDAAWERMHAGTGLAPVGIDRLRQLVDLVSFNESVPGQVELHCVLSAEATALDHPARPYFQERYRSLVASTGQSFATMSENGQLADGVQPLAAARNLIALMDGLQVQWLLDRESVSMSDEVRAYLRPLLTVEV